MAFELPRRTSAQVPNPVRGASTLFMGKDGNARTKRDDGSVEPLGPAAWVPKWKDSIGGNFFVNGDTVSVGFGEVAMFTTDSTFFDQFFGPSPPEGPEGLGNAFGYVRLPKITPESVGRFAGGISEFNKFGLATTGFTGSITNTGVGGAQLNDGETVTLDDAVNPPITYEFDENGGGVTPGNVPVVYTPADDSETIRFTLGDEINTQFGLGNSNIEPLDGGPGVIDLRIAPEDAVSPVPITETVADPNFIVEGITIPGAPVPLIVLPEPGDAIGGLPAGNPTPPNPTTGIPGEFIMGPGIFWSDGFGTWYHFNGLGVLSVPSP